MGRTEIRAGRRAKRGHVTVLLSEEEFVVEIARRLCGEVLAPVEALEVVLSASHRDALAAEIDWQVERGHSARAEATAGAGLSFLARRAWESRNQQEGQL